MEALVLIVAEILSLALGGLAAIIPALAMAAVDLIVVLLELLFGITFSSRRLLRRGEQPESNADHGVSTQAAKQTGSRRRHWLLAPLAALAAISVVVNFVFFEVTTRWAVERFASKAGFAVNFEQVEGNIYSGRFNFQNLTVLREPSERTGFDLQIARAAFDVDLWSLIYGPISLESLDFASVRGQITKPAKSTGSEDGPDKIKPKRRFVVERMQIQDTRVKIRGADGTNAEVAIVTALSQPFRSDLAVFDFFFRSTVDAHVDGHPVNITTEAVGTGRRTNWDIKELPVSSVAGLVPRAPIDWFDGGSISAEVSDEWALGGEDTKIETDWRVTMRGVNVKVPSDAGAVERLTAAALAKVVNGRADDVTFDFTIVLDEEDFRNSASLDAADFWKTLVNSVAKSIAARNSREAGEVDDEDSGTKSLLKKLLGRKAKEEP
ncbi:MAG TPA: hypothetical protein VMY41_17690 [Thermohalobaculum sp.]|nr:hypothetical protein [Thermohalobaculum sp.]